MKARKFFLWIPGVVALLAALLTLLPPGKTRGFDTAAFAHLPVLQGGRVKPLDSVARNSLLMIRGKQSVTFEGRTIEPDEWVLDVCFRPAVADAQPLFVINDPDVLGLLGIQQSSNRYYRFSDLTPHLSEIQQQAQTANSLDAAQRTRFQNAVLDLFQRLIVYHQLANTFQFVDSTGLLTELQAAKTPGGEARYQELSQVAYFRPLPPLAGQDPDAWETVGDGLAGVSKGTVHPALELFGEAGAAYAANEPQRFSIATKALKDFAATQRPDAQARSDHEFLFNQAQPFYLGMVIYVLALITVFLSWAWKPDILRPMAFSLLAAGLFVHTAGLASRILLQGRPPVTNLYSSAIFVGWVAVVLGVILERMYRRGFATAVAGAAGFASLIVAHHLSGDGDTMEMMRAVLDSNFWLATHVVSITVGYGGTFLAGSIAIAYTLRKHLVAHPDDKTTQALLDTTYGILCFSLLFSFVGTVLGGIWADQSWGRFWGWDPKENGALLIVLWNALILHARWGNYVQERGLMAMAIVGNIITSLAWFGVNLLNVGLHSYGFTDKGLLALSGFILTQLVLVGLCLLPRGRWTGASRSPSMANTSHGQNLRVIHEGEVPLLINPANVGCGFMLFPNEMAKFLNESHVHQALAQNKAALWAAVRQLNPAIPVHLMTASTAIEPGHALLALDRIDKYRGQSVALDIMQLSPDGGQTLVTVYAGFSYTSKDREVIVAGPQMILPERPLVQ